MSNLTNPNGIIRFYTGSLSDYNSLAAKGISNFYLVNDTSAQKFYAYVGENPVYSLIDSTNIDYSAFTLSELDGNSNKPIASKAVYAALNDSKEVINAEKTDITSESGMNAGYFYYYPNAKTLKFSFALGEGIELQQKIENPIIANPSSSQIINNDLTLNGNLALNGNLTLSKTEKIITNTIEKASGNLITLNNNSKINGSLSVTQDISVTGISATGKIFTSNILEANNLLINSSIENADIFTTVQASGGAKPKITLESDTEFYFGSNYYLKPGEIYMPGGTISNSLTISSGNLTLNSGAISAENIDIKNGFKTEADTSNNKWVKMNADLSFDENHTYYIKTQGTAKFAEVEINSITTNTLKTTGKASLDNLEISKTTSLVGATTLSNTITTNYFNCTLDGNKAADKMTMIKPLYFGASYYINTAGIAKLASFEISNGKILDNLELTKINNAYEFIGKTISAITEGTAENQSGSAVTGVTARLTYAGQQVLTKADLTATNGLIKSITDGISTTVSTLNTTVTNNKTATDAMIVIANAGTNGAAPAAVTANTKIWIDTAEGNGVIKIKNGSGVWTPVSSVWT